jgi:hypothetical protein
VGSWLQEGIEDYDRTYMVNPKTFTVNGWRMLCFGFLKYVEDLDLTNSNELNDRDNYIVRGLDHVEDSCADLIKTVQFLKKIEPPKEYHYGFKRDPEQDDYCPEMDTAIKNDIQEKYEQMWLSQIEKLEGEEDV